jgi:hypothetical protein
VSAKKDAAQCEAKDEAIDSALYYADGDLAEVVGEREGQKIQTEKKGKGL